MAGYLRKMKRASSRGRSNCYRRLDDLGSVQDGEVLMTAWRSGRDGWVLMTSAGDRPVVEQVFEDGPAMLMWLFERLDKYEAEGAEHLVAHISSVLHGIDEVFCGAEGGQHGFGIGWGSDQ